MISNNDNGINEMIMIMIIMILLMKIMNNDKWNENDND